MVLAHLGSTPDLRKHVHDELFSSRIRRRRCIAEPLREAEPLPWFGRSTCWPIQSTEAHNALVG
jgi:hypothetical protein